MTVDKAVEIFGSRKAIADALGIKSSGSLSVEGRRPDAKGLSN